MASVADNIVAERIICTTDKKYVIVLVNKFAGISKNCQKRLEKDLSFVTTFLNFLNIFLNVFKHVVKLLATVSCFSFLATLRAQNIIYTEATAELRE